MAKAPPRGAQKAALNRCCCAEALHLERRQRKAVLRSEKEVFLRKRLWQERERRARLEKELERCRCMVNDLRAALCHAVSREPPEATRDPYMIIE